MARQVTEMHLDVLQYAFDNENHHSEGDVAVSAWHHPDEVRRENM
jgi:hypothetical protein